MKVVILNNDFRAYWKSRLTYLHSYLATQQIEFKAIELFGKGSPYTFDKVNDSQSWWTCLFPDDSPAELSKFEIKKSIDDVLDRLQPDMVIGPSIVFFPGALGIAWAKRNKKKFIMFDDAKPSQIKRNFIVQTVKNLITSQADSLWLPSKSYDKDWGHFKKQGVSFFYGFNSIDNIFFNRGLKYSPGNKYIICVARLVPVKNIDSLLKAWQLVEQLGMDYRLMIIGNGPEELHLKKMSGDLDLKSIEFVNAVNNEVLPAYFKRSAAFILPSLSETWGLVVNEAMASGLPVLLSDKINAAGDLLQEGLNGFSFSPGDVTGIAATISKFIKTDDAIKIRMSAESLNLIDEFSFEKMGTKLLKELNKLAAQPVKPVGIIANATINLWYGRYNTARWDKLDNDKNSG